jgi:hypothetical protein
MAHSNSYRSQLLPIDCIEVSYEHDECTRIYEAIGGRCILIYIMRRTQIYLREEQDRRLEQRARAAGATKSALIREAIDRFLRRERSSNDLETALKETAGALPGIEPPPRDEWTRGYG